MDRTTSITTPLTDDVLETLEIGQMVQINGIIYTARDAAHIRFVEAIDRGEPLPIDIRGQIIFYTGPAPARPGMALGPTGPTTSYRMDPFAPTLIAHGLKGMIGKGARGKEVIEAMKKYKAAYFAAMGGVAAWLSKRIIKADLVAYEDLGTEAVRRLVVKDFPVIVINDIYGNDLYERGKEKYRAR